MTDPYGPRTVRPTPTSPLFHYGEDRGWGNGTRLTAPEDGVIVAASYSGAYGNRLIIRSASGDWWLCHMASFARTSGRVAEGEYVGEMGQTGNVTAKHLHTEHRIRAGAPGSGEHTNPANYYGQSAGTGVTIIMSWDTPTTVLKADEGFKDTGVVTNFGMMLRYTWAAVSYLWDQLGHGKIAHRKPENPNELSGQPAQPVGKLLSYIEAESADARNQLRHEEHGLAAIADLIREHGNPSSIEIRIDKSALTEALADPDVAKAFAVATANEIDRRNNVKRA